MVGLGEELAIEAEESALIGGELLRQYLARENQGFLYSSLN
jgi:hypothetical protein